MPTVTLSFSSKGVKQVEKCAKLSGEENAGNFIQCAVAVYMWITMEQSKGNEFLLRPSDGNVDYLVNFQKLREAIGERAGITTQSEEQVQEKGAN